jgi:hypothetical protein
MATAMIIAAVLTALSIVAAATWSLARKRRAGAPKIVRIITVTFLEDDIVDGDIGRDAYEDADIEEVAVDGIDEAVDLIQRHGLTFAATGSDWASDPDGSRIVDYYDGRREEVSAHFADGWTDREMDRVMDRVG